MKKICTLILTSLLAFSVFAESLSIQDREKISYKLSIISKETKSGNWAAGIDFVPPAVFSYMAKQMGTTSNVVKTMVVSQTSTMMEQVRSKVGYVAISQYDYRTDVELERSNIGRKYIFIPTYETMRVGNKEIKKERYTLGLVDKSEWYFVNWDAQYMPIIEMVYPDLKGIKPPIL